MEYSDNLEEVIDLDGFCDHLRLAALETGVFPMAGIRVRAMACKHYSIADGGPEHGFIDISIRLRGGRPDDKKKSATEHVFAAAKAFLQPHIDAHPFALSLEMRDIDPDLSPKLNTIRDHIEESTA
jgi:5-carboxymethyl-2-hydroxymuconate isomerase